MNKQRSKKSKLVALLLSFALLITMFPAGAFAAPGNGETTQASSLEPGSVTSNDELVTIEKSAERTGVDTWDITMTVDPKESIQSAPVDIVLAMDGSGSMNGWKQISAQDAASNLVDFLANQGVNAKVGVISFGDFYTGHGGADYGDRPGNWGYEEEEGATKHCGLTNVSQTKSIKDAIKKVPADKATNMQAGLDMAVDVLNGDNATTGAKKVIIFLSDGEYKHLQNSNLPDSRFEKLYKTAGEYRDKGIDIYTVGFANQGQGSETLKRISSTDENGDPYFYTSNDLDGLTANFQDIATRVIAMVTDYMGDYVTLDRTPIATLEDGTDVSDKLFTTDDGSYLSWNPDLTTSSSGRKDHRPPSGGGDNPDQGQNTVAELDQKLTITYSVKLKDDWTAQSLWDESNNTGNTNVVLNGPAALQYTTNDSSSMKVLDFKKPSDTVETAALTIWQQIGTNGPTSTDDPSQYAIIWNGAAYDDNGDEMTFDWVDNEDSVAVGETTYNYAGTDYVAPGEEATDMDAEDFAALNAPTDKGEYQLIHHYSDIPKDNGTDVTVQVVLDGTPVTDEKKIKELVDLSRDTSDTNYNVWTPKSIDANGVMTFGFNYYEADGNDCVDIKVDVLDDNTYILQGVNSYQNYGKPADKGGNGTKNVNANNDKNKTYTVDNVTAVRDTDTDKVDCTIYLNTKYSIEYYEVLNNGQATEIGNDSNVYIAPEKVTSTDPKDKIKDGQSAWMNWQNTGYATSATLDALPSDGVVSDGWYLGSVDNKDPLYPAGEKFTAFNADSDKADNPTADRIIKFFATTADAASYPVVDKSVYSIAGDTVNKTEANVGDTIVYAIKIKNEGNIATTMTLSDSMSNDQAITTFYTKAECTADDVVTDEDLKFDAGQEKIFYAKYEVTKEDKGETLKNTITVTDSDNDKDDDPSEEVKVAELYNLVYDANGGQYVDGAKVDGVTFNEDHKTATESDLQRGDHDLNTEIAEELATRQTSDGIDVIFVGWTEDDAVKDKVYDKDAENVPKTTNKVMIDSEGERVYALWAEDANGNDVPDYQEDQYTLTYNANGGSLTDNLNEKVEKASVDGLLPNTEAKPNYPLWDKEGDQYIGTIPDEVKDQWSTHEAGEKDKDVIFIGWTAEADTTIYSKNDKDDFAKVTLIDNVVLNEETMGDNTEKDVFAVWGYDEDGDGIPDVQEDQYSLTYHSTSGYFGDKDTITAPVTGLLEDKDYPLWSKDEKGQESGTAPEGYTWPMHDQAPAPEDSVIADEGTNVNVAFIGWTETDYTESYEDGLDHIFAAGEAYPEVKTTTHIPPNDTDMNRDVYAIWGYDENGDGIADAQQIVITPADITIYMGGNGYEGVVEDGEDNITAGEDGAANGLPEPGYYLILPAALDEQLGGEGNTEDLSNQLRL